jgi:hypothetical protein
MCYVFLLIVCILAGIIYIAFAYFVKIMYKDFKVKLDGDSNILSSLFSVPTFIGIGIAVILGIFHWQYFNNVIYPALNTIKKAIYNIDLTINNELTKASDSFNAELFTLLCKKSKGIEEFTKYAPYVQSDIKSGQIDKAKQKIIMIILYSHLHDQIPNTNMRAMKLINYYFVKNPISQQDTLDIRDADELNDLTFISLLVESAGIQQIKSEYINYDFYTCTSELNQTDVNKVRSDVKLFFKDLNNQLLSFPEFKSNLDLFAWYFVIFFVLSFILVFIFMKTIKDTKSDLNKSISYMAGNISAIMTKLAPQLDEFTQTVGGAVTTVVAGTSNPEDGTLSIDDVQVEMEPTIPIQHAAPKQQNKKEQQSLDIGWGRRA